jgi:hypothetical protein
MTGQAAPGNSGSSDSGSGSHSAHLIDGAASQGKGRGEVAIFRIFEFLLSLARSPND